METKTDVTIVNVSCGDAKQHQISPFAIRSQDTLQADEQNDVQRMVAIRNAWFRLVSPRSSNSSVAHYLTQHPPGVADIAFQVKNLDEVCEHAIRAGATLLHPPHSSTRQKGAFRQATVSGWGDLSHTLVEYASDGCREDGGDRSSPFPSNLLSSLPVPPSPTNAATPFTAIDHIVLNVPKGEMKQAAEWYVNVFGFEYQQSFSIQTARSALKSVVLTHPNGNATLPINEPASTGSQIQEFLDVNRGAGVQHIALLTPNIVTTMAQLRQKGVAFLNVPSSYYDQIQSRKGIERTTVDWEAIARQEILVDWQDHHPEAMLLQAFTQPIFGQPTFFFEIIQRQRWYTGTHYHHAEGFGEGNFQALFEAIEREQIKRGSLK